MSDELALAQIKRITVDEYKAAFSVLREQMAESDLLMLKSHCESPNYDITATQLSHLVGFQNFNTANLRYGLLAKKFLEFFQINSDFNLPILVGFENVNDEWHWILLPKVVQALGELKWFGDS
jgi:hypothetical protein